MEKLIEDLQQVKERILSEVVKSNGNPHLQEALVSVNKALFHLIIIKKQQTELATITR